jgi:hypothetical protein
MMLTVELVIDRLQRMNEWSIDRLIEWLIEWLVG